MLCWMNFCRISIGVLVSCFFALIFGLPACVEDPVNFPCESDSHCREGRVCVAGNCTAPDGGLDAASDGPMSSNEGGSNARPCQGTCIPPAPEGWSPPQPFWHGQTAELPDLCPNTINPVGTLVFDELVAPPLNCPTCACGPVEGSCSPNPTILIRAANCNVPQSPNVDFTGPQSWDGSCTSTKALGAGVECPPGSGVLCAQSVYSGAMPDPVEACEPNPIPVPSAGSDALRWANGAKACSAEQRDGSCTSKTNSCLATLEGAWRYCIQQPGVHDCPAEFGGDRFVMYPDDGVIDKRDCSECSCGASGGKCYGTLRIYEDEACSSELLADPKDSIQPACSNLNVFGVSIGSKQITNVGYIPGTCKPSGGFAFGSAEPDATKAITWCCLAPSAL